MPSAQPKKALPRSRKGAAVARLIPKALETESALEAESAFEALWSSLEPHFSSDSTLIKMLRYQKMSSYQLEM